MVRKPWMVSNAKSSGILSRDSSTAIRWSSLIRSRIGDAEDRAEPVADPRFGDQEVGQQLDLLQLFLERHPREQVVHARLDPVVGRLPCRLERLFILRLVAATMPPAAAAPNARINTAAAALSLKLVMFFPWRSCGTSLVYPDDREPNAIRAGRFIQLKPSGHPREGPHTDSGGLQAARKRSTTFGGTDSVPSEWKRVDLIRQAKLNLLSVDFSSYRAGLGDPIRRLRHAQL